MTPWQALQIAKAPGGVETDAVAGATEDGDGLDALVLESGALEAGALATAGFALGAAAGWVAQAVTAAAANAASQTRGMGRRMLIILDDSGLAIGEF